MTNILKPNSSTLDLPMFLLQSGLDYFIIVILILLSVSAYIFNRSDDIAFLICLIILLGSIAYLTARPCIDSWFNMARNGLLERFDGYDFQNLKSIGELPVKVSKIMMPNIDYVLSTIRTTDEEQTNTENDTDTNNVVIQEDPSMRDKIRTHLTQTRLGKPPSDDLVEDYVDILLYLHTIQGNHKDAFDRIASLANIKSSIIKSE